MNLIRLAASWKIAKANLAYWKATESRYRLEISNAVFPSVTKGTNYSSDGVFKLVAGLNYTLDKDHNQILAALESITKAFPDLNLGELISWNPKLNEKEYEALPAEAKTLLNPVLTIKPAMPQLSFAAEKEAKSD